MAAIHEDLITGKIYLSKEGELNQDAGALQIYSNQGTLMMSSQPSIYTVTARTLKVSRSREMFGRSSISMGRFGRLRGYEGGARGESEGLSCCLTKRLLSFNVG